VELVVYNSVRGKVRIVKVVPNYKWGGEGILGCNILSGVLHRIPKRVPNIIIART
jgi:hypothetical protein